MRRTHCATRSDTTFWGTGCRKRSEARSRSARWSILQRQRLRFVTRNFVCRGGEIDLVMREIGSAAHAGVRRGAGAAQPAVCRCGGKHRRTQAEAAGSRGAALSDDLARRVARVPILT